MTEPFDLFGPLPRAPTVLEASAGTGKTFTIASLVARYVAEGVADGRAARRELQPQATASCASGSASDWSQRSARWPAPAGRPRRRPVSHLADAGTANGERAAHGSRRRSRSSTPRPSPRRTASASRCCSRSAPPATTTPARVLVENIGDLVAEVADDLYLRKWGAAGTGRRPT